MQDTTPVTPAETDPKRRYLCRHVFTEGHRCGSPALRGQSLCYNHNRVRRDAPSSGSSGTFPMPRIDDRASIQLALYEVLSRLAGGDIEYKRGTILLYGLQIASSNLPRAAKSAAEQQPQVEEVTSDYDLGDLAPITEIPDPEQEAPLVELEEPLSERDKMNRWLASLPQRPQLKPALRLPGAPTDTAVHATTHCPSPTEVVILSEAKNPPEAPQTPPTTLPLTAEIWAPATNRHPETFFPLSTIPSPQPITLAAVQAVGNAEKARLLKGTASAVP